MLPHFELQQVGSDLAVHDRRNGSVHLLNETSAQIWSLALDGGTAVEIVENLIRRFPEIPRKTLQQDVQRNLDSLTQAGLLPQDSITGA